MWLTVYRVHGFSCMRHRYIWLAVSLFANLITQFCGHAWPTWYWLFTRVYIPSKAINVLYCAFLLVCAAPCDTYRGSCSRERASATDRPTRTWHCGTPARSLGCTGREHKRKCEWLWLATSLSTMHVWCKLCTSGLYYMWHWRSPWNTSTQIWYSCTVCVGGRGRNLPLGLLIHSIVRVVQDGCSLHLVLYNHAVKHASSSPPLSLTWGSLLCACCKVCMYNYCTT